MSKSETFWAPMDRLTLSITLVAAGMCMGLPIYFYKKFPNPTALSLALCIFPIVVFLLVSLFAIKSYHLEDGVLRIKRTLWSTRLPLQPLESVALVPGAMAKSWRLWGIGGMFGWIGWFRNKPLGNYRAWVTDRNQTVVFISGGKTYVVSPMDPEKFVRALEALKT